MRSPGYGLGYAANLLKSDPRFQPVDKVIELSPQKKSRIKESLVRLPVDRIEEGDLSLRSGDH